MYVAINVGWEKMTKYYTKPKIGLVSRVKLLSSPDMDNNNYGNDEKKHCCGKYDNMVGRDSLHIFIRGEKLIGRL